MLVVNSVTSVAHRALDAKDANTTNIEVKSISRKKISFVLLIGHLIRTSRSSASDARLNKNISYKCFGSIFRHADSEGAVQLRNN